MKNQWKGFVSGAVTMLLLFAFIGTATAVAYQKQATLNYPGIKITLDGNTVTPTDASGVAVEPFTIDGTTYLPVRGIAGALGLGVVWDQATQTVHLTSNSVITTPLKPATTPAPDANDSGTKFYPNSQIPLFENITGVPYTSSSEHKTGALYKYPLSSLPPAYDADGVSIVSKYAKLLQQFGFELVPTDEDAVLFNNYITQQSLWFDLVSRKDGFDRDYCIVTTFLTPSGSSSDTATSPAKKTISEGTFKVGVDIQAGTYKLTCTGSYGAYWARCKDASGEISSIIANENFNTTAYVTVTNGEYLQLSQCTGTLQP